MFLATSIGKNGSVYMLLFLEVDKGNAYQRYMVFDLIARPSGRSRCYHHFSSINPASLKSAEWIVKEL